MRPWLALSGLAALLFASTTPNDPALALDYTVAYALEAGGKAEKGKLENCNAIDLCRIKFRTMGATALLSYFTNAEGRGVVTLSMDGDSACCFFRDGNASLSLDPDTRLHILLVYAGHARRGNESINNERVGTLYLSFSVSR